MKKKGGWAIGILSVWLFSCSCAKEGLPPGGPEDIIPPEILSSSPRSDLTDVNVDIDIEIVFSKAMDKEKTERSIFISPGMVGHFDFKWKGRRLIVRPSEFLVINKTYVVTVGVGACDLHNNHLARPFCLAFSTGEKIDQGKVCGRVFFSDMKKGKVSIWAYPLNDKNEPNPGLEVPEYAIQSDEEGDYELQYLSTGEYRLFAVDDVNGDLKWELSEEPIGVAARDVILISENTTQENLNFVMTQRDSAGPGLLGCRLLDRSKLELDFSEKPDSISLFDPGNYHFDCDGDSGDCVKINSIYLPTGQLGKPCLLLYGVKPRESYRLTISNLADRWSNKMDTSYSSCTFLGMINPDTIPPEIFLTRPQNGEHGISLDSDIRLFFDEPMDLKSVQSHFFLEDESGRKVGGIVKWIDSVIFIFVPDESLQGGCVYRAGLQESEVFDMARNRMSDSLFKTVFTTLSPETLGQISGKVGVSEARYRAGDIIVTANKLGSGAAQVHTKILKTADTYKFTDLLPGRYAVLAFVDLNGNGKLDLGNPFPFIPAEPQTCYPDTVTVRSRWETEGIDLLF